MARWYRPSEGRLPCGHSPRIRGCRGVHVPAVRSTFAVLAHAPYGFADPDGRRPYELDLLPASYPLELTSVPSLPTASRTPRPAGRRQINALATPSHEQPAHARSRLLSVTWRDRAPLLCRMLPRGRTREDGPPGMPPRAGRLGPARRLEATTSYCQGRGAPRRHSWTANADDAPARASTRTSQTDQRR